MPRYVVLYRFTADGAKNIRETVKRARQTREQTEKRGFKVQTLLWTQGPYDLVSIIDATNRGDNDGCDGERGGRGQRQQYDDARVRRQGDGGDPEAGLTSIKLRTTLRRGAVDVPIPGAAPAPRSRSSQTFRLGRDAAADAPRRFPPCARRAEEVLAARAGEVARAKRLVELKPHIKLDDAIEAVRYVDRLTITALLSPPGVWLDGTRPLRRHRGEQIESNLAVSEALIERRELSGRDTVGIVIG